MARLLSGAPVPVMRCCRHAQPQRGGVLRRRWLRRRPRRGARRRRAGLPADDLVRTRPVGRNRGPGHLDGAGGQDRLSRGRPVRRRREQPGPVGGLRPADRARALVASARRRRHHPGAVPERGRPRRRRLAHRGQLRGRRAAAGQRQFPRPRAAGAVPAQRRRRGQRADQDPARVAPGRRPCAGPGGERRTALARGGDSGGGRQRGPADGAGRRFSGRRVPVPPVPGARRLVAAPRPAAPDDGSAGRGPARPVPADGPAQPGRAGDSRRRRPGNGPGTATGEDGRARRSRGLTASWSGPA